jgi:hypothetical protein
MKTGMPPLAVLGLRPARGRLPQIARFARSGGDTSFIYPAALLSGRGYEHLPLQRSPAARWRAGASRRAVGCSRSPSGLGDRTACSSADRRPSSEPRRCRRRSRFRCGHRPMFRAVVPRPHVNGERVENRCSLQAHRWASATRRTPPNLELGRPCHATCRKINPSSPVSSTAFLNFSETKTAARRLSGILKIFLSPTHPSLNT